ncbi:hypothetical protein M9458_050939, partial [Cirrhinus mrigala]
PNLFIKVADDTTVVVLATVMRQTTEARDNNLTLNVEKMKEIVVDFRRAYTQHAPLSINGRLWRE